VIFVNVKKLLIIPLLLVTPALSYAEPIKADKGSDITTQSGSDALADEAAIIAMVDAIKAVLADTKDTNVINPPSTSHKGTAIYDIVLDTVHKYPSLAKKIREVALNAAPDYKTDITYATNYAIYDNAIRLADARQDAPNSDNPAQTNIYTQEQANIYSAIRNGEMTEAQGYALLTLLFHSAPNGSGVHEPLSPSK
jgi:hypothetical protein